MTTTLEARSVLTAGYVPLDIVVFGKRMWHGAGGTAGNVAAILSFLGWRAGVVVDVGDDVAGREVVRDLRKANVDTHRVRLRSDRTTARVIHEISGDGHRFVFRCPNCASRFPRSRPLPLQRAEELAAVESAPTVFFFDRLNPGTVRLAEHFAAQGTLVVFEPARGSQGSLQRRALAVADIVKYADDRIATLGESTGAPGRSVHVVTHGAAGASYRVGSGIWHHSPAFSYPTIDAGGAGDWTTAGLVHALISHEPTVRTVGDALRWAQALAAVSCGAPGARGLARQQTAEAVMRAAHFLEVRRVAEPPRTTTSRLRRSKVDEGLCKWCLLPTPSALGGQLVPRITSSPGTSRTASGS